MRWNWATHVATLLVCLGFVSTGCDSGDVGAPCVPEEEYLDDFSGFAANEVSTESRSYQCETRVCLINHFQGRVTCPYGQTDGKDSERACYVPGTTRRVAAAVDPQLVKRRSDDAVYCSCRCKGPDKDARYCECPSGYQCEEVVPEVALGKRQLVGSYCVREGTTYDRGQAAGAKCNAAEGSCG